MLESIPSGDIAHVIQLAVAPVFLLTGVAAILGVMANRLARVVDRARAFEARLANTENKAEAADLRERLGTLSKRAKLISHSLTLCTLTALLICAVIITLFVGAFVRASAAIPAALLFIAALLSFALALIWFLREIFLATATLRIGPAEILKAE